MSSYKFLMYSTIPWKSSFIISIKLIVNYEVFVLNMRNDINNEYKLILDFKINAFRNCIKNADF